MMIIKKIKTNSIYVRSDVILLTDYLGNTFFILFFSISRHLMTMKNVKLSL